MTETTEPQFSLLVIEKGKQVVETEPMAADQINKRLFELIKQDVKVLIRSLDNNKILTPEINYKEV
jgi:hypothetical protein